MKSTTQVYVYENKAPVICSDFIKTSSAKFVEFYEKETKTEYVRTTDHTESYDSRSHKSLVFNDVKKYETNAKSSVIDVKYERSSTFTPSEFISYEPVFTRQIRTVVTPFLTPIEIHERLRNLFLDSFLSMNRKESILDTIDELTKKVFESSKESDSIEIIMPSGRCVKFDWNNIKCEDKPIEWTTTKKVVTFR